MPYTILGIDQQNSTFRVRMFVGDKMIDEDFPYVPPKTAEEAVTPLIEGRLSELEALQATPDASLVAVDPATNQLIADNPDIPTQPQE